MRDPVVKLRTLYLQDWSTLMNPLTPPPGGVMSVYVKIFKPILEVLCLSGFWNALLRCGVQLFGDLEWSQLLQALSFMVVVSISLGTGDIIPSICSYQGLCQVFVHCLSSLAEICGDRELNCHHQEVLAGVCQASFITEWQWWSLLSVLVPARILYSPIFTATFSP